MRRLSLVVLSAAVLAACDSGAPETEVPAPVAEPAPEPATAPAADGPAWSTSAGGEGRVHRKNNEKNEPGRQIRMGEAPGGGPDRRRASTDEESGKTVSEDSRDQRRAKSGHECSHACAVVPDALLQTLSD